MRRGGAGGRSGAGSRRAAAFRLASALFVTGLVLFITSIPAVHSHVPGESRAACPVCRIIIQGGTPEPPPLPPDILPMPLSAAPLPRAERRVAIAREAAPLGPRSPPSSL